MKHFYSGYVNQDDGSTGQVPFDGPSGWNVDKQGQTEIFKVHHGLGLKKPHDLRVVVTTVNPLTIANVQSRTANDFTVSVWTVTGAPTKTDFSFIALVD